ncbi:PepSY domain-containing protein [Aliidiomarina sp.]|uniref:PepSY domain-containing protein n=1 Tax=Aliidiomarina sp. TaxID=1872439 RepID=UPI0025C3FF59|nr:PepSY domain-containing protein [Aliidiomarina sp.]
MEAVNSSAPDVSKLESNRNGQGKRLAKRRLRKQMKGLPKPCGVKTSMLVRIHRSLAVILCIQLLIWVVSGFYFSWQGREALSATQYQQSIPVEALPKVALQLPLDRLERLQSVRSIELRAVDGLAQFKIEHDVAHGADHLHRSQLWFDATSGRPWFTSTVTAQRLAVQSYAGPGLFGGIEQVSQAYELPTSQGRNFRVNFQDELNTRVYINEASGDVMGHRNDPWVIADWMYRLHFMDYSGARNFNNVLIITLGLLCLWFVLSGVLLLVRIWQQGGFVVRR